MSQVKISSDSRWPRIIYSHTRRYNTESLMFSVTLNDFRNFDFYLPNELEEITIVCLNDFGYCAWDKNSGHIYPNKVKPGDISRGWGIFWRYG